MNTRKNLTGKNKFPIATPTACRWKWAWSSIYVNTGNTASCHRSSASVIDVDDFENFHNTPEKVSARQTMLNGQWPTGGCEYCERIENAGGISDRLFQNTKQYYPAELDINPTQTVIQPVELEVFINNTCNLACLYCNGSYSSKIVSEDRKHNKQLATYIDRPYTVPQNNPLLLEKFVSWFEKNGHSLRRLNILGGEPLYQKEFYKLLEIIEAQSNSNLELAVTTNLMTPKSYIEQFHEVGNRMLKKRSVKTIDLQCSVEGLGTAQEYVRYGFDSEQWKNTFEELLYHSHFRMMLLSTVNILVVDDMLALAQHWLEWKKHKDIFWTIHDVMPESSCLNLSHYDPTLYESQLQKVVDLIDDQSSKNLLMGVLTKSKNLPDNKEKLLTLKKFLNEVDHRRHSDWRTTFPWLTKTLDSV